MLKIIFYRRIIVNNLIRIKLYENRFESIYLFLCTCTGQWVAFEWIFLSRLNNEYKLTLYVLNFI